MIISDKGQDIATSETPVSISAISYELGDDEE